MILLKGTGNFISGFLSLFAPKTLHSIIIMATSNHVEITTLSKRLSKAEANLAILTREISDIKDKLKALQSSKPMPSSSAAESSVDGSPAAKRMKVDFQRDGDYVIVFTDGACENNGKLNAKAGIGVWFSDDHPCNVSKPVSGRPTNNTAEIQACIEAVRIASKNGVKKLCIKTDSQFVINSMTQWIKRWKSNSWKLASGGPVKNKEDFITLDEELKQLKDVKWMHVNGHCGIKGNEQADKLARAGAELY